VRLTVLIDAQPLGNDHKPCGEFASSVGGEDAQSPEIVFPKTVQNERVVIHRFIVSSTDSSGRR